MAIKKELPDKCNLCSTIHESINYAYMYMRWVLPNLKLRLLRSLMLLYQKKYWSVWLHQFLSWFVICSLHRLYCMYSLCHNKIMSGGRYQKKNWPILPLVWQRQRSLKTCFCYMSLTFLVTFWRIFVIFYRNFMNFHEILLKITKSRQKRAQIEFGQKFLLKSCQNFSWKITNFF